VTVGEMFVLSDTMTFVYNLEDCVISENLIFCSFLILQLLPLPASYPVSPDDGENSDVQVC